MRNIVVSGGGSGIGQAVCAAFAAAGDSVLILGRREDKLAEVAAKIGPAVTYRACDLSSAEEVTGLADDLGTVDVLVNCAGGRSSAAGSDLATVQQRWTEDFAINVLTAVLLTEAVLPHFSAKDTRLISISSIAAQRGNDSYGAAKAALHGWNHSMVARMAAIGGTANLIVSGFVAGTEFFGTTPTDAELTRRAGETAVGRVGQVSDIVSSVTYLASPDAGFVTGQLLGVNGGAILGR